MDRRDDLTFKIHSSDTDFVIDRISSESLLKIR